MEIDLSTPFSFVATGTTIIIATLAKIVWWQNKKINEQTERLNEQNLRIHEQDKKIKELTLVLSKFIDWADIPEVQETINPEAKEMFDKIKSDIYKLYTQTLVDN